MMKREFIEKLRKKLSGMPKKELEERLNFYSEMIDDRIEEGCTEQEAVWGIGSVEQIAAQIIQERSPNKTAKEPTTAKRRMKGWEIALLALGSPIWLSLAAAAFAVVISLYAAVWSVIISLWASFGALVGCSFGGVVAGIFFIVSGDALAGFAVIGAGIVCVGLAIFLFFASKAATKGVPLLTKKLVLIVKKSFVKKEKAE